MSEKRDLMAWIEEALAGYPERGVYYLVALVMGHFEAEMNRRGMTKTELAKRAGLNRAHLSRIFADPPNVTMGTLVAIANALDLRLDIIVLPKDAPPTEGMLPDPIDVQEQMAEVLGS